MYLWRAATAVTVLLLLTVSLAAPPCEAAPKKAVRRRPPPKRSPSKQPLLTSALPPPLSPPPSPSPAPRPPLPLPPRRPRNPPLSPPRPSPPNAPLSPPPAPTWPDGPSVPPYPSPPPRPPAPPFPPGVTAPSPPPKPAPLKSPPSPKKSPPSPPAPPYPPNSPFPPYTPPGTHSQLPPSPPAPPAATNASVLGYYAQVGIAQVIAVHMAIVPGTDTILVMERPSGNHPDGNNAYIAGTINLTDHTFEYVYSSDSLFCCGHTPSAFGDVVVVGGHRGQNYWDAGLNALRLFDRKLGTLTTVAQMKYPRWYPSVTLLQDGQVLIMGGTQGVGAGTRNNAYYELWDPANPTKPTTVLPMLANYLASAKQMYYPFNYVMPTGDMFTFCSRFGRIMDPYTGLLKGVLPKFAGAFNTEYPYTGTSVLLPLMPADNYTFSVVVFGGQDTKDSVAPRPGLQASPWSRQVTVFQNPDKTYNFSSWGVEYMGMPRVMGDATLLPNGKIILLDGAMYGEAGDAAPGGGSNAFFPAFYAYLFDPLAPVGKKYKQLERSQIARLYHSTACLTPDGTIVVAGCDRCYKFSSTLPYQPATTASGNVIKAEYRVEVFYPPYWYSTVKPTILTSPENIDFGVTFTVTYNGTVTGANLVASSSTTHSFNMHQRLVGLVIVSNNAARGVLTLRGPPGPTIAVPSMYLLFLLNGDDYSKGAWLTLTAPAGRR